LAGSRSRGCDRKLKNEYKSLDVVTFAAVKLRSDLAEDRHGTNSELPIKQSQILIPNR